MKLRHTNTNVFKAEFFDYLLDCAYDCEDMTKPEIAQHLADRFHSEYCHPYEVQRTPNHGERLGNWLQGLPINIDYTYHDIVLVCCKFHGLDADNLSDTERARFTDNWFNFCAFKMLQMFEHYNVATKW